MEHEDCGDAGEVGWLVRGGGVVRRGVRLTLRGRGICSLEGAREGFAGPRYRRRRFCGRRCR